MKILVTLVLLLISAIFSQEVSAAIGLSSQGQGNRGFPLQSSSSGNLSTLIANTISLFFAIGGIGFIIMMLWGSVSWILSGGDKEKIAGARKRITTSIIGLVLLSSTYVVMLVLGQILGLDSLYSGTIQIKGLLTP